MDGPRCRSDDVPDEANTEDVLDERAFATASDTDEHACAQVIVIYGDIYI